MAFTSDLHLYCNIVILGIGALWNIFLHMFLCIDMRVDD